MSRVRIPGKGFEVGRSVCGVRLRSFKISDNEEDGIKYKTVQLHFFKNDVWISKYIDFKRPRHFDDPKVYRNHRRAALEQLENVAACYISGEHLKNITFRNKDVTVGSFINDIEEALRDVNYWKTPVCIKTIPGEGGAVYVGRFAYFMKPEENANWNLIYNTYEKNQYLKFKNYE